MVGFLRRGGRRGIHDLFFVLWFSSLRLRIGDLGFLIWIAP